MTLLVAGNFWGMSFNPVVDRVRVVNDLGGSVRRNPDDGLISGQDSPLSGSSSITVDSVAYDNQVAGAATTTLFALNSSGNALARIVGAAGNPSPNLGVVTNIGLLGVTLLGPATALDFAPNGARFSAFGSQGAGYTLYTINTINTTTGAATPLGLIGTGAPIDSLAVASAGLTITPGSGTFTTQQRFDVGMLLNALSVVGGSAIFDGLNASAYIAGCITVGSTASGLAIFRCPSFGGQLFGSGTHTFSLTLVLDNGASVAASVTWVVLPSTEP